MKNLKRKEWVTSSRVFFYFPLSISVAPFVQIFMSNTVYNLFFEGRIYGREPKQTEFFIFYFSIFREERYSTLSLNNDG